MMRRVLLSLAVIALMLAPVVLLRPEEPPVRAADGCTWAGEWETLVSGDPQPMTLAQAVEGVTGTYANGRRIFEARIPADRQLVGRWQSSKDAGRFAFTINGDCSAFDGTWGFGDDTAGQGTWTGVRAATAAEPAPPPTVEELATGLRVPWSLAFAPDGRLFVAQQPCRVDVLLPAGEGFDPTPQPVAVLPDCVDVGDGLRGLVLAPDFATSRQLYVVYTYATPAGPLATHVSRWTERDGTLADEQVVLQGIPGGEFHTAGRLAFGPDGMLYLATGDALNTSLPQDPASLGGKVLRFTPDGGIPADNPTPGSLVWSTGHRNPQGLAWHPTTGDLFIVDHGPSPTIEGEPFSRGHDEINRVVAGSNYGWPLAAGNEGAAGFIPPVLESGRDATWAPSSALFYTGDRLAAWRGSLFYGGLIGQHLGRVTLAAPDNRTVAGHERLFQNTYGRIRATAQGSDGCLYFVTSNTDGRSGATPRPGDDRLLRVVALPTVAERRLTVRRAYLEATGHEPDAAALRTWTTSSAPPAAIIAALRAG